MSLIRAGVFSSLSAAARLLVGLAVVKLVAIFAGPEGLAKMGQFMNITSLLALLAGGGISSGIVKYVAEYQGYKVKLRELLGSALTVILSASTVTGVLLTVFANELSSLLFNDGRYIWIFFALAVGQFCIAFHNYFLSIINGFIDVRRVALINLCGAIAGLFITAILSMWLHLFGALLSLVLSQAILVAFSYPALRYSRFFDSSYFRPKINREMMARLAKFAMMTITSALLTPLIQIWVRNHLLTKFSWQEVGYWQAVSKVSEAYLMVVIMTISVYYLPKLSSITDKANLKAELVGAFRQIIPFVSIAAAGIYIFRNEITVILFSKDFLAGSYLYGSQLIGDILRISSYIFSYAMIARAMTGLFIISELLFAVMYVVLVKMLTEMYGLSGAVYAFGVSYFIYFAFTLLVTRMHLRSI